MSDIGSRFPIRGTGPIQSTSITTGHTPLSPITPQTPFAVTPASIIADIAYQISETLLSLVQAKPIQATVGAVKKPNTQILRLENGKILLIPTGILKEGEKVSIVISNPSIASPRVFLIQRNGSPLIPPVEIPLLTEALDFTQEQPNTKQSDPALFPFRTAHSQISQPPSPADRLLAEVVKAIINPLTADATLRPAPLAEGSKIILKVISAPDILPKEQNTITSQQHPIRGLVLAQHAGKAFIRTILGDLSVPLANHNWPPGTEVILDVEEVRPPSILKDVTRPLPTLEPLERFIAILKSAEAILGSNIETLLVRGGILKPETHFQKNDIERFIRSILIQRTEQPNQIFQITLPARLSAAGEADLGINLRDAAVEFFKADRRYPQTSDWHVTELPVLSGQNITPLRIFYKKQSPEASKSDGGSRFIIELELSSIGHTQLDGLLKQQSLNLILRTHQTLPEDIRNHLTLLVKEINQNSLVQTHLNFHVASIFQTRPREEIWHRGPAVHVNLTS